MNHHSIMSYICLILILALCLGKAIYIQQQLPLFWDSTFTANSCFWYFSQNNCYYIDSILQAALDEATEPWGIKVERVEM